MPFLYQSKIHRYQCRNHPEFFFIFGDNLERRGFGGQAREMRGESNAVGLPTKRSPRVYLTDADLSEVKQASLPDMKRIAAHLRALGTVIWPKAGIGTGLAELPYRAPAVFRFWQGFQVDLELLAWKRTYQMDWEQS